MVAAILIASVLTATPAPMTLAQAIDFASTHNQQVLVARASWIEAGATLARDRSAQLPNVQAAASSTMDRRTAGSLGSFAQLGIPLQPNFSQNTAQVQGGQSIFDLQNQLTANQARHSYDEAAQNYRLVREQTVINVETAYYGYVQNVQLVGLALSDFAYQQTLYSIADANYRSGRVAGIDRLKAQVQRTSSQESLASTQADAEDSRENLAQTIGADASQQFVVPASIPVPQVPAQDQKTLVAIALAHRPDVAMAKDALANAVLANGLVDAPNRPTVALQGAVGNQSSPTQIAGNLLPPTLGGCNAPYCAPTHFYTIQLNSQITLPLVDWGTLHSAHRGARATIDSQTAAFEAAERQALIDVDQTLRRMRVDEQNLSLATQNADVAKQAAQIAQVQYKVGLGSQIDVTSAEQTYLQAAKQLLAAQIGYVLAADKLKLAMGTLVAQ
jgi:outer membrane protein